jgi:ectoine hydroxylase-related dioxygenase (phytanoyl-CoA dioxygenase family)
MTLAQTSAARPYARYRVRVEEYVTFHRQGFLVVKGLVPPEDVAELAAHCEDVVAGRIGRAQLGEHVGYTDATWRAGGAAQADAAERQYNRIHMLHRHLEIHERFLLHPRILDVLEALIGPDVLALQSMLFLKPPGADGQGYHQDSYYIPTLPDTLCGAWLAIDRADVDNGCVRFCVGSQHEPIYPDAGNASRHYPGARLDDLTLIEHASDTDEARNGLTPIARRYAGQEVPAVADPGDVVFFGGHILHRSLRNESSRFRRSFVGHYCNARSYTEWDYGYSPGMANGRHILARGRTHLPYAPPRFGTPCAANQPPAPVEAGTAPTMMGDAASGLMGEAPTAPERLDPAGHQG